MRIGVFLAVISAVLTGCANLKTRVNSVFAPAPKNYKSFMVCGNFEDPYMRKVSEITMVRRLKNFGAAGVECNLDELKNPAPTAFDEVLELSVTAASNDRRYIPYAQYTNLFYGANSASGLTVGSGGYSVQETNMFYKVQLFKPAQTKPNYTAEFEQTFTGKTSKEIAEEWAFTIVQDLSKIGQLDKK